MMLRSSVTHFANAQDQPRRGPNPFHRVALGPLVRWIVSSAPAGVRPVIGGPGRMNGSEKTACSTLA